MHVTVIGGSGFIGTRLVGRLLDSGQRVKILDKAESAAYPELTEIVDVRDGEGLRRALGDTDAVINLAAEHRDDVTPRSLYEEVNVGGARNVCQAAESKGVVKIVFTSSVAVYGEAPPDTDEAAQYHPFNEYGRTKLAAESVYRQWFQGGPGRSLVIVRPTVVFGENNRGNVYNLLNQMASGRFVMVGTGSNVKSMAYVENVASFLEHVLGLGDGVHLFNYVDKPDFDMNSLVRLVKSSLGQRDTIGLRLPFALGYLGGLLLDGLGAIVNRKFPISAIRVKKFCMTTQFSSSRIADTGFVPVVTLEDGLSKTIEHEFLSQNHGKTPLFYSE